jgi:hypothetical protein
MIKNGGRRGLEEPLVPTLSRSVAQVFDIEGKTSMQLCFKKNLFFFRISIANRK